MMTKEKIIETLKELPEEVDLEDLIERLIFTEKVTQGLQQLDEEKTISHEEVKIETSKWSK